MKILMAAMSMGLGGAETHILELSRELVRRGHGVTVASAGGVYTGALCDGGVRHVTVPLDRKDPVSVALAIRTLSRLIESERFDIVHAHARIPAFICGMLKKKYRFNFITTAHFDFRTDAVLSRITEWGDAVLAVSEDIGEGVAKKYGYPAEKIRLVNNGVDAEKFAPGRGENVRKRLGVDENKVVMYLGRLDADSFLPAEVLIKSTESIHKSFPEVRIVIVGAGEMYARLCALAKNVNETLGDDIVIMAGGTSVPEEYIAACDVFVGPSRSAIEALSSGKPTVVAGSFGMLGIFSRETEREAMRTNFCCRGSEPATAEKVSGCVRALLSLGEDERAELSAYGRELVKKHYSVSVMADTCLDAYGELIGARKNNVVICGYYGYGNIGDEAMLLSLVRSLRKNARIGRICVMSANPEKTRARFGTDAVHRFDIRGICAALAESDTMIFGGGNILQDKTSTKSLLYYAHMISLASRYSCRTALCANGIGPITRSGNMDTVKKALLRAEYISMRDGASAVLAGLLTGREDIFDTSDITFSVSDIIKNRMLDKKESSKLWANGARYYAVFPKKIDGVPRRVLISFFCAMKRRYGLIPVFAAMHRKEDMPLCRSLVAALPWARCAEGVCDAGSIGALLGGAEFALCMRLHAAVFSVMAECPVIALSDDDKIAAFFSSSDMEKCALLPVGCSASDLTCAASRLMLRRDEIAAHLHIETEKHREKAVTELERLNAFLANE